MCSSSEKMTLHCWRLPRQGNAQENSVEWIRLAGPGFLGERQRSRIIGGCQGRDTHGNARENYGRGSGKPAPASWGMGTGGL